MATDTTQPKPITEDLLLQLNAVASVLYGLPDEYLDESYTECGECQLKHFEAFDEYQLAESFRATARRIHKLRDRLAELAKIEAPEAPPSRYA